MFTEPVDESLAVLLPTDPKVIDELVKDIWTLAHDLSSKAKADLGVNTGISSLGQLKTLLLDRLHEEVPVLRGKLGDVRGMKVYIGHWSVAYHG